MIRHRDFGRRKLASNARVKRFLASSCGSNTRERRGGSRIRAGDTRKLKNIEIQTVQQLSVRRNRDDVRCVIVMRATLCTTAMHVR